MALRNLWGVLRETLGRILEGKDGVWIVLNVIVYKYINGQILTSVIRRKRKAGATARKNKISHHIFEDSGQVGSNKSW